MAESGDSSAALELATLYRDGVGASVDLCASFNWALKAAQAGEPQAMYMVGLACRDGVGTSTDITQWFEWILKASKAGDEAAVNELADAYAGNKDADAEQTQHIRWAHEAAQMEVPAAMYDLALAYQSHLQKPDSSSLDIFGEVEQSSDDLSTQRELDQEQYLLWMEKAAAAGVEKALSKLIHAYAERDADEYDVARCFHWTKVSAERGDTEAMLALAQRYEIGAGIEANEELCGYWMEQAAAKGDSAAIAYLALLGRREEDVVDALELERATVDAAGDASTAAVEVEADITVPCTQESDAQAHPKKRVGSVIERQEQAQADALQRTLLQDEATAKAIPNDSESFSVPAQDDTEESDTGDEAAIAASSEQQLQADGPVQNAQENRDPAVLYALAQTCIDGEHDKADEVCYFELLKAAAEAGDNNAAFSLALAYEQGIGTEVDLDQYFKWIHHSAEGGDAKAMVKLALAYDLGQGIEVDAKAFFEWTKKAAQLGDSDAMYNLAIAYDEGSGTEPNSRCYLQWMEKSAEAGDRDAMFNLALAYAKDDHGEPSQSTSFQWMRKAAESGDYDAMFLLAEAYREGKGTRHDYGNHFMWMERAAQNGITEAMYRLSVAYTEGIGIEPDSAASITWLEKAAAKQHPAAMRQFGLAYKTGCGVEASTGSYVEWIRRAADANDCHAMCELAEIYARGVGIDANSTLHFKWIKKAAEAGDPGAMHQLATTYKNIEPDASLYFEWSRKAAEAGVLPAMYNLAHAYKSGEGTQRNHGLFKEWMEKAALGGHYCAVFELAVALATDSKNGSGLERVARWASKAAEQAHPRAFIVNGLLKLQEKGDIDGAGFASLYRKLSNLHDIVQDIKAEHVVGTAPTQVAYFTDAQTMRSMLPAQDSAATRSNSYLRLYSTVGLSDVQEGRRLLEVDNDGVNLLASFFSDAGESHVDGHHVWHDAERSVYTASFFLNPEQIDAQFAERDESGAYCIISPLNDGDGSEPLQATLGAKAPIDKADNECTRLELYRVFYKREDATRVLRRLHNSLLEINLAKAQVGLIEVAQARVNRIVRAAVSEILYLYKPETHAEEREARLIAAYDISAKRLKLDEQDPPRLYIETENLLFDSNETRIIIGPQEANKTTAEMTLKYHLTRHNPLDKTEVRVQNY
ncbi:MAG: sel1 repeat family protein [Gammaproteobacteria bacterium]|nr:sel1 repeat family protein [Gammaproteobacteria bacterium]